MYKNKVIREREREINFRGEFSVQDQCAGGGSQEIRSIVNTNKHEHPTSHRLSYGCKAVIQDTTGTIAFSIPLVHIIDRYMHNGT